MRRFQQSFAHLDINTWCGRQESYTKNQTTIDYEKNPVIQKLIIDLQ